MRPTDHIPALSRRQARLLLLLHKLNGDAVIGRLMCIGFILRKKNILDYRYERWNHGPYSPTIRAGIDQLFDDNLVNISPLDPVLVHLLPLGKVAARAQELVESKEVLDIYDEAVTKYRGMPMRQLNVLWEELGGDDDPDEY